MGNSTVEVIHFPAEQGNLFRIHRICAWRICDASKVLSPRASRSHPLSNTWRSRLREKCCHWGLQAMDLERTLTRKALAYRWRTTLDFLDEAASNMKTQPKKGATESRSERGKGQEEATMEAQKSESRGCEENPQKASQKAHTKNVASVFSLFFSCDGNVVLLRHTQWS